MSSPVCAECGRTLRAGGRRPAAPDLPRYCMAPACRAAKQRDQYARRTGIAARVDAPTECSNPECKAPLKPRKVRRGDSAHGRWCSNYACQRDRAMVESARIGQTSGAVISEADQDALNMGRFLLACRDPSQVVDCFTCGDPGAVVGYVHPRRTEDGIEVCRAMGQRPVSRELAMIQWPHVFEAV